MKKLQLILFTILCLNTAQNYPWGWFTETFVEPVQQAAEIVVDEVVDVAEDIVEVFKKPVDNFTTQINNIEAAITRGIPLLERDIGTLTPQIQSLLNTVSNGHINGNISVLEQAAGKIDAKIAAIHPPEINLSNLAALDLQGFFNQIKEVYQYIQTPLQATTNIIHIMYTTLGYASNASRSAGNLCTTSSDIINAFNFSPVNGIVQIGPMVSSLGNLNTILTNEVPKTLNSISDASQHIKQGYSNLYTNIGNTLTALETQLISLQKAAMALNNLGNIGNVAPPPPPPAPPTSPTGINLNDGTLPPPPPFPG